MMMHLFSVYVVSWQTLMTSSLWCLVRMLLACCGIVRHH